MITRKMADNILTAKVAIVHFGAICVEGLLFEDGRYGVAVQQLNALISFSASKNTASRDLKRLLGAGFSPSKARIQGTRQLINCILLADFEKLLLELAIAGNIKPVYANWETPADAIDWAQEVTGLPRNVLIEEFATLPNDGKKAVAWVNRVTAIKK